MARNCLADIADVIMGQSPPGSTVSSEGDVPLLNGPTEFGPSHPFPTQYTSEGKKFAEPGDLLFCVRGSTTGRMNWADQRYAIGRGIAAIRHRNNPTLQPLIRAILQCELPSLLPQATGSTFPNISAQQLSDVPWTELDLPRQRVLATILRSFEDRIELNRRIGKTLDAVAAAFFKSWFIDFEPVRFQSDAHRFGLPVQLADLFPTQLISSDLGPIPAGWNIRTLGDVVETVTGRSYRSADIRESDTALVTLKSFSRAGGYRPSGLKPYTGIYRPKQVVQPGEIVVPCTDITQDATVIGRPATVQATNEYCTLVASLDVLIVRPTESGMTKTFLYFTMHTRSFLAHMLSHTTGTTVLHLDKSAIPSHQFVCPPPHVIRRFDKLIEPTFARSQNVNQEIMTLTSLRDHMLPRLLKADRI